MESIDVLRFSYLTSLSSGNGSVASGADDVAAEDDVMTSYRMLERYTAQPQSHRAWSAPQYKSGTAQDDDDDFSGNDSTGSEFYDTDIEQDSKAGKVLPDSPRSKSIRTYRHACDRNGVPPMTSIVNGLQETEVNVRHRCLGDGDAHALSVALSKNSSVTRLELGGNNIGSLGALYLKSVLTVNPNIVYLDLSENDLGRQSTTIISVADVLRANTYLQTLILHGNNLRDQDAIYLAAGIMSNSHLIRLDLSRNMIGEIGGVHLGRAFAINNAVEILDLSWNNIRQKGAVALCRGLQENGYVTKLNVAWNGFGYEGALAVGELLKKNESITELDLSSNRINWQGIRFIIDGLVKNKTLETLLLNSNPLTTTGCMDLIESITQPHSAIINLGLKGVPVVRDFEFNVEMIRQLRPDFTCQHGGIVGSHDVIGQRLDKRITPIQKIINLMKEREYRPTELFRMLDKNVQKVMTHAELAKRLQKFGVKLPSSEVEELMEFINATNFTEASSIIDFQSMSRGVKSQIDMERHEKIRERERNSQLRQYHKSILGAGDDVTTAIDPDSILPNGAGSLLSVPLGRLRANPFDAAAPAAPVANKGKVMSMSTALGGKVKQFGKAVPAKKSKRKKKTGSKKKHVDSTDYDNNGTNI